MRFAKYHGTGNDFVMVEDMHDVLAPEPHLIVALCDRRTGVGADGLIRIATAPNADFFMDYYNASGEPAEMCGNGIRCLAKFAYERGLTAAQEIDVATRAGIKHLVLTVEDGVVSGVTVAMGPPSLERRSLPMAGDPASTHVGTPIEVGGRTFPSTAVSMGNPHLVLMLESTEDLPAMDDPRRGSLLENRSDLIPNRANVEFVKVVDGRIHMRVWERGSGETMACGTGACAALVACSLAGLVGREAEIEFPGGVLWVEWRPDGELYLTGPAVCVFDGELDTSWLRRARPEAAEARR